MIEENKASVNTQLEDSPFSKWRNRALLSFGMCAIVAVVLYSSNSIQEGFQIGGLSKENVAGFEDTEVALINRKDRIANGEYIPPPPEKVSELGLGLGLGYNGNAVRSLMVVKDCLHFVGFTTCSINGFLCV